MRRDEKRRERGFNVKTETSGRHKERKLREEKERGQTREKT